MRTALFALPAVVVAAAAAAAADPRTTPIVLAYRAAAPAVVNISTETVVRTRFGGMFGRDDPFDEIFPFPSPFEREIPVRSLGSGFLVHRDGYVVTNAHVVRRAQKITVTLHDETKLPARVISADDAHDLAVLKVAPPNGKLPHLPPGRSDDLMVGETVIAIGNPLGYASSLTTGVVSAVNRKLEFRGGVTYEGLIQTDAPINPGSSGGPLLNIKGELIGINTAIRADAQNIGFAIAVDDLADQMPRLLDFERLNRVVFGADVTQIHGADGDAVLISAVRPKTPAAGGLRGSDRILAVDGQVIRHIPDYCFAMLAAEPGSTVRLQIRRGSKDLTVPIVLKAKPRPDGKALARGLFGMQLREITPELARDYRLPTEEGLVVVGVDVGSPAERIGLRPRDVLFQVGKMYVKDLDALGMQLEDVTPRQAVGIGVVRGRVATWVSLRADRLPVRPTTRPKPTSRPIKGEIDL